MTKRFVAPQDGNGIEVAPELASRPNKKAAAAYVIGGRTKTQVSAVFDLNQLAPATPPPEVVSVNPNSGKAITDEFNEVLGKFSYDRAAEQYGIRQHSRVPSIIGESKAKFSTAQRGVMLNLLTGLLPNNMEQELDSEKASLVNDLLAAVVEYFDECGDAEKTLSVMVFATEPVRYNNGVPNKSVMPNELGLNEPHENGALTFREVISQRTNSIRREILRAKAAKLEEKNKLDLERQTSELRAAFDAQSESVVGSIKESNVNSNRQTVDAIKKIIDGLRDDKVRQAVVIVGLSALALDGGVAGENTEKFNRVIALSPDEKVMNALKGARCVAVAQLLQVSINNSRETLQSRFNSALEVIGN